ncbi:peptidase M14 [Alcaligenaceae bacterium B3P038]|nr:peptidase M14 [Alcaligenaceae bacterium B3P038]
MTTLLDRRFTRTLDSLVDEFSAEAWRGGTLEAWVFDDRAARIAAEQRLARAGVTARFRSAYKPLIHAFVEDIDLTDVDRVTVRYPVHPAATAKRFTLEAYPLVGMLANVDVTLTPGEPALVYAVELSYRDGRTQHLDVFAPNVERVDHTGAVNLTPTGWVRASRADDESEGKGKGAQDAARTTDLETAFAALIDTVRLHPWGTQEPYFERLSVRLDMPGSELDLHYGDEVVSLFEALHEDIYFSLLEIFQLHSGRPLGDRGLQPGQFAPDVRTSADDAIHLVIATEPFAIVTPPVPSSDDQPLAAATRALPIERVAYELDALGGERFDARSRQGRTVWGTYVKSAQPAIVISAAQHANESSGVVGVLRAAHALRDEAHFALIGVENPDGYAMHRELCATHPRHMHHAARYSALGDDIAYRERAPFYEREARQQALAISGASLHINLHGYPAHEWTRPMSGYLPRGFELWTIPKGFFLILRHHPGWGDRARALIEHVTQRLGRLPGLLDFNARQIALFRAHALEDGFEMLNGIPILVAEDTREAVPLALISEFPDETIYGDDFVFAHTVQMETVLAAHEGYVRLSGDGQVVPAPFTLA